MPRNPDSNHLGRTAGDTPMIMSSPAAIHASFAFGSLLRTYEGNGGHFEYQRTWIPTTCVSGKSWDRSWWVKEMNVFGNNCRHKRSRDFERRRRLKSIGRGQRSEMVKATSRPQSPLNYLFEQCSIKWWQTTMLFYSSNCAFGLQIPLTLLKTWIKLSSRF